MDTNDTQTFKALILEAFGDTTNIQELIKVSKNAEMSIEDVHEVLANLGYHTFQKIINDCRYIYVTKSPIFKPVFAQTDIAYQMQGKSVANPTAINELLKNAKKVVDAAEQGYEKYKWD